MMRSLARIVFILIFCTSTLMLNAQLSPGDLSTPHSNLEGMSNCTQCHVLGNKVSNEKCLTCHTEIQTRISNSKGYHSSSDVKGKDCFLCHSEHNGKNFQLIRLDITKFDHKLTGYPLSQPHAKKACKDCHDAKFIIEPKIKTKKSSYLGVGTECLNCHADYHMKTLGSNCLDCHTADAFKPASKFNHDNAKFKLLGKHKTIDCLKCHKTLTVEGKKFQEFRGLQFSNCTNCHKDPHNDKFGQNCRQCHTEESFQVIKGGEKFDHNKTNYKLEEKHLTVNCKACHKTKFTDPLKYAKCIDCHSDYHNKQFVKNGVTPDCAQCHSLKGFTQFNYTIEQHNQSVFPLQGAHSAIPCFECHKKQEKWNFREIGKECKDCHKDIHQNIIQAKYYPQADCKICHIEQAWKTVSFDHSKTEFKLTGTHSKVDCRTCHFKIDSYGIPQQKFQGLPKNCSECHTDNHYKQFDKNGTTNCLECHSTNTWKESVFDHNNAAFKLDGKHVNVPCAKCHKPTQEGQIIYVKYKLKVFTCESCHS